MTLSVIAAVALAQAVAAPAASPCAGPEYHQFDFWVGRWDVYNPKGQMVAHSLIEPVYGCGIRENWMPLGKPGGGGSLNIYVPDEKRWEQFWIDSDGSRALLTGGWYGAAMDNTCTWS